MEAPTRGSRMTLALLDGLISDERPFGEPPIDGTRRYCRYSSRPAATKAHSYRGCWEKSSARPPPLYRSRMTFRALSLWAA
jgi:hypothetical protein